MLKKGSSGNDVKELQSFLGIKEDGIFGTKTENFVKKWQSENNLIPDGIVGPATWDAMGILSTDSTGKTFQTKEGLNIKKYYLDSKEFYTESKPEYLFLHHTAGWENPYKCIDDWNNDNRGRIATEFVIGGQSINGLSRHNGETLQAFPPGCWGWHLGTGRSHMHKNSVGIEVCNFGWIKNGKTYTGARVREDQIITLGKPFKGYREWHKYSDEQLKSLKKLILYIAERDNIDVKNGLPKLIREKGSSAFEYNQDAKSGKIKGLLNHTNVNMQKFDMFPQNELLDMLLSL